MGNQSRVFSWKTTPALRVDKKLGGRPLSLQKATPALRADKKLGTRPLSMKGACKIGLRVHEGWGGVGG